MSCLICDGPLDPEADVRRGGWQAERVELSETMAEHARSLGAVVHQGLFADAELPGESFDAVTMWDYLEHSTDPVADLRRAAGLLRANGVVVLTTCDAASLAARLSGSRWHLLIPRHHYFFFTPASLGRAGLRPLAITHPGGRYSVGYLAHKLRTLADVAPLRRVADWTSTGSVGGVSVPVNLFDIMTVVAIRQPPPGV